MDALAEYESDDEEEEEEEMRREGGGEGGGRGDDGCGVVDARTLGIVPELSEHEQRAEAKAKLLREEGLVRGFGHVDGRFPVAVYLQVGHVPPWAKVEIRKDWREMEEVSGKEPHMSLSRPFSLGKHEVDAFLNSLRESIMNSKVNVLEIEGGGELVVFGNDDGTRKFQAISFAASHASLLPLLHAIDTTVTKFGAPPYYTPPHFHVSVAWARGNGRAGKLESIPIAGTKWKVKVSQVRVKVGKDEWGIPLGGKGGGGGEGV